MFKKTKYMLLTDLAPEVSSPSLLYKDSETYYTIKPFSTLGYIILKYV